MIGRRARLRGSVLSRGRALLCAQRFAQIQKMWYD